MLEWPPGGTRLPTHWRHFFLRLLNFWPPFLGAGIRLRYLASDFSEARVEMKLRFWNRNYVGVHFGGSLYAMTDPFYMLLVMEGFRERGWLKQYIIWDKEASVRFKKPGTGKVRAHFKITDEQIRHFKQQADLLGKFEPLLTVQVLGENDELVAEIDKRLYIRKKRTETAAS